MLIWRGFYVDPNRTMRTVDTADAPVFSMRSGDAEPHCVSAVEGTRDAESACFLARIANLAADTVLFLDIDNGCTADYFAAWIAALQARGFTPGISGGPSAVTMLSGRGIDLAQWVFRAVALDEAGNVAGEGVEQWVH